MKEPADRFTKTPCSVKPHLDPLKVSGKIAHLTMFETIVSECHGRKDPRWTVTSRKLIAKLVADTRRKRAPNARRSQKVINELEAWGLVRRYCARSGALLAQLPVAGRKLALRSPDDRPTASEKNQRVADIVMSS